MKKSRKTPCPEFVSVNRKDLLFALACVILILVKHMLAAQLPLAPRPNYRSDDHLMIMMARNIMGGRWLGAYSFGNLMKGSFFPLFLSATHLSGISYLSMLDLLNSASALYFTLQLKPVIRKRGWMLLLFASLLFNPVNISEWAYERVYRCSITNFQVLFIFGAVVGAYLDRKDRFGRQLARAVFCGFILWSAWNTREDAVWMLPFPVVAGIVMLVKRLKEQRSRSRIVCAAVLFLMPFLVLLGGNAVITAINQSYYGLPVRNEASAGFGKMIKTMYSIKNPEEVDRVSVSAEKLERMYAVSPSLSRIRPELTESLEQAYKASERVLDDGEVEDGWFYWCIRRAVENAGIAPTLSEADAYYRQVTQELEDAIRDPDNHFETQWVMPSALMSPWRAGYAQKLAENTVRAMKYMVKYDEVSAGPLIVQPAVERISYLFEGITGNASLHSEEQFVTEYRQIFIDRAETVIAVYRFVNPALAILTVVLYLLQGILAVVRRKKEEVPWLLIATGFGLSILLLLVGAAYTDMTAFIAVRYTYLTGGYALMLACEWIVIARFANGTYEYFANSRKRKNPNVQD